MDTQTERMLKKATVIKGNQIKYWYIICIEDCNALYLTKDNVFGSILDPILFRSKKDASIYLSILKDQN